jgi:hypothetical protein
MKKKTRTAKNKKKNKKRKWVCMRSGDRFLLLSLLAVLALALNGKYAASGLHHASRVTAEERLNAAITHAAASKSNDEWAYMPTYECNMNAHQDMQCSKVEGGTYQSLSTCAKSCHKTSRALRGKPLPAPSGLVSGTVIEPSSPVKTGVGVNEALFAIIQQPGKRDRTVNEEYCDRAAGGLLAAQHHAVQPCAPADILWCSDTQTHAGVIPDLSWGSMNVADIAAWKKKHCDELVGITARTQTLMVEPDLALAATNREKRPRAYKPFKLSRAAVKAHRWLQAGQDGVKIRLGVLCRLSSQYENWP